MNKIYTHCVCSCIHKMYTHCVIIYTHWVHRCTRIHKIHSHCVRRRHIVVAAANPSWSLRPGALTFPGCKAGENCPCWQKRKSVPLSALLNYCQHTQKNLIKSNQNHAIWFHFKRNRNQLSWVGVILFLYWWYFQLFELRISQLLFWWYCRDYLRII